MKWDIKGEKEFLPLLFKFILISLIVEGCIINFGIILLN